MRFNTIGVSDGISMGTDGMSYSLQSRDLIADSIETVMGAQWYDACIALPGCDKNMPGCLMAMGRLNRPAIMVYGGTIRAGHTPTAIRSSTSSPRFSATAQSSPARSPTTSGATSSAARMSRRRRLRRHVHGQHDGLGDRSPGHVAALQLVDPGRRSATSSTSAAAAGEAIRNLLEKDLKPRDIMTREAFENAMVIVMAVGGSTNAVLHLIAMARAVDVPLTIDDFQTTSDRVPYLADLKPSGKYVQEDLHDVGGTPAVMKLLLDEGLLDGDCLTSPARRSPRIWPSCRASPTGQKIVHPLDKPIKTTGHIRIMRGNFCPDGAVAKITGKEGLKFTGPANCFDREEDMLARAWSRRRSRRATSSSSATKARKAAPACPRCSRPPARSWAPASATDVALITDGRFSGGSTASSSATSRPKPRSAARSRWCKNGDQITIDAEANTITIDVSDDELARRRKAWKAPPYKATRGTLYKYIKNVKSAAKAA